MQVMNNRLIIIYREELFYHQDMKEQEILQRKIRQVLKNQVKWL